MLTAEKSEARKRYLGGTDAPAVLGLSRWKTPLQVWGEKVGVITNSLPDTLPQKLGKRFEEVVAELFMEQTGKKVRRVNETLIHPKYPFLGGSIDRRVVGENAVLECKTAAPWKSKEWAGDEIPEEYVCQVLHYMAVGGFERGYLAILLGNTDFKIKVIERDEALLSQIVSKEVEFWQNFVEPNIIPKIVKAADGGTLYKLFPDPSDGSLVVLPPDSDHLIETILALKADARSVETQIDQKENELKLLLGENELGLSNQYQVSWKAQTTRRLDSKRVKAEAPDVYAKFSKETKTRVLRIAEKGELNG